MINIYTNTLKSTIDNKNYHYIILNRLHIEIFHQYGKYYKDDCVAEDIIIHYLSDIEYYLILYHKDRNLKNYYKKQININIELLLNYLNEIKNGNYR